MVPAWQGAYGTKSILTVAAVISSLQQRNRRGPRELHFVLLLRKGEGALCHWSQGGKEVFEFVDVSIGRLPEENPWP
eukprot:41277-Eustigmatos_ZCMA.PRE.1